MPHFAKIENGKVIEIIVASHEYINNLDEDHKNKFIQTSYNTVSGVHLLDKSPLRKNYAGIGYTYDATLDAFIPPKPFLSWILHTETCQWIPPIDMPDDGNVYKWNEDSLNWVMANDLYTIKN